MTPPEPQPRAACAAADNRVHAVPGHGIQDSPAGLLGGSGEHPGGQQDADGPNIARIYDYLLGGSHNFAADRAAAGEFLAR